MLLAAVRVAAAVLSPAPADGAAQQLTVALRAAVAAPPSAGANMPVWVLGGEPLLAAVRVAATVLLPAPADGAAQQLMVALRAAVAAPPSAGANMPVWVLGGEQLVAAVRAAVAGPPTPPADEAAPQVVSVLRAAVASPPSPSADLSASVLGGEPLLAAVRAAAAMQPPAFSDEAAQQLVAAVRAAVAVPPPAPADEGAQ